MANVTIQVQSLINTAVYDSFTVSNTANISSVKTTIQSTTSFDPSWYDLYYNGTLLSNASATLSSYGIDSNVTLRTANKISRLSTREARQDAKLALAALDRADSGHRSVLDIASLPTQYSGNVLVNNDNSGGLTVGRPWTSTSYSAGLYRSQYASWPNQNTANPTWFDGKTATATAVSSDFSLTLTAGETSRGYQWLGYIKPDWTGTWTFTTSGVTIDDCLTVWIGSSALSGYTTGNSVLNISLTSGSGTISLTADTYYPIRVQYANNSGPGTNHLRWSRNGSTASTNFSSLVYYNSATNGF